jgi:hypothetical protein
MIWFAKAMRGAPGSEEAKRRLAPSAGRNQLGFRIFGTVFWRRR